MHAVQVVLGSLRGSTHHFHATFTFKLSQLFGLPAATTMLICLEDQAGNWF